MDLSVQGLRERLRIKWYAGRGRWLVTARKEGSSSAYEGRNSLRLELDGEDCSRRLNAPGGTADD